MSPEVLTGRSVSTATDVYGLGLIFFEMMSAEKIFEGKTVKEVCTLIY
jgi:serine/threonine protein kinase